jgi:hypothetical protein
VYSLRAENSTGKEQKHLLDLGLENLKRWYEFGLNTGWRELGQTIYSEIYRIAEDRDLKFLYQRRKTEIEKMLGENKNCLKHYSGGFGAGGCIPAGTAIDAPEGPITIENLQTGTAIFSASLTEPQEKIKTTVIKVYRSEGGRCVCINNDHVFTSSQPLYSRNHSWIFAGELSPGDELETVEGRAYVVSSITPAQTDAEVYTLTTNHSTHNFIVSELICRNKMTDVDISPPYKKQMI